MAPRPRYYKDSTGKWRWSLTARNGRRTHSATESFSSKRAAKENFELIVDYVMAQAPQVFTEVGPILE